jgi:XTP/dITP diphosphohydrolase
MLATTNPAKAEQLRWVFADLGLELRLLPPSDLAPPEENGATFAENAEIKARHWSRHFPMLVAASDGGMSIPALGSRWNALRTARAAGPAADDLTRARHLLRLCEHLEGAEREVFWSEALVLASHGRSLGAWTATGARAVLVEHFAPSDLRPGFWAASLCYLPELGATLAELPDSGLAPADSTWAALRTQVRAFFASEPLRQPPRSVPRP